MTNSGGGDNKVFHLQVQDGVFGESDLRVTADNETWIGFLAKEKSLLWALLGRRPTVG